MRPVSFKGQNMTFTKPVSMTDEECCSLPALKAEGEIISCWKMDFKERLKALFTGIIWFSVCGPSQPPIWLGTDKPFQG